MHKIVSVFLMPTAISLLLVVLGLVLRRRTLCWAGVVLQTRHLRNCILAVLGGTATRHAARNTYEIMGGLNRDYSAAVTIMVTAMPGETLTISPKGAVTSGGRGATCFTPKRRLFFLGRDKGTARTCRRIGGLTLDGSRGARP
jgi:hypothetical protein